MQMCWIGGEEVAWYTPLPRMPNSFHCFQVLFRPDGPTPNGNGPTVSCPSSVGPLVRPNTSEVEDEGLPPGEEGRSRCVA